MAPARHTQSGEQTLDHFQDGQENTPMPDLGARRHLKDVSTKLRHLVSNAPILFMGPNLYPQLHRQEGMKIKGFLCLFFSFPISAVQKGAVS